MSFFTRMNSKLDEGWKLSNINCEKCKSSILIQPVTNFYYCPKCDVQTTEPITVMYEVEGSQDIVEKKQKNLIPLNQESSLLLKNQNQPIQDTSDEDSGEIAQVIFNKPSKSDEYSKKLSQKLLQGWAMLDEVCEDCLIPIMKSKVGKKVCVGCEGKQEIKYEQPKLEQIYQKEPQEKIAVSKENKFRVSQTLVSVFTYYDKKIQEAIQKDDIQRVEELTEKMLKLCLTSAGAIPGIKFD